MLVFREVTHTNILAIGLHGIRDDGGNVTVFFYKFWSECLKLTDEVAYD